MLVRRTDAFPHFVQLQRGFDDAFGRNWARFFNHREAGAEAAGDAPAWTPAVDVVEQEDQILLRAELPGLADGDVEITLEDGRLTLKGEKRFNDDATDGHYRRIESGYGSFSRTFNLPTAVDQEGIDARFNAGVLVISLPKVEQAKPKKIAVTVN